VAIPMYCMYELSILAIRVFGGEGRREPETAVTPAGVDSPPAS
jgi:Sec-independent protein secretion pathway component TatC